MIIINNPYFTSIVSSIIAVFILYKFQVEYCKYKIKKDFRVNEAIMDIYNTILNNHEILSKKYKDYSKYELIEYFEQQQMVFKIIYDSFFYKTIFIIIESIEMVFFINLNFKLLNIINHIKNRQSTFKDSYDDLLILKEKYSKNKSDVNRDAYYFRILTFCMDMKFLSGYYHKLFEYLGVNIKYLKCVEAYITAAIAGDSLWLIEQPYKTQNKIIRKAQFRARYYLIKEFFIGIHKKGKDHVNK